MAKSEAKLVSARNHFRKVQEQLTLLTDAFTNATSKKNDALRRYQGLSQKLELAERLPEGKSVAIKFLPPNSNLSEVHVGCLAFRESALHLGQTLYYTTEVNVWKNPSAPPYPFIVMETGTFKHKKKSHISSLSKTTQCVSSILIFELF